MRKALVFTFFVSLLASACTGSDGAQGPVGAQGEQGPTGEQGPAGPAGEDGMEGPQGPQGPEGPEGPAGPEGPEGPQGPEGPDGTPEPTDEPVGLGTALWDRAGLEDRNEEPAAIVGHAQLVRDDISQYFIVLDGLRLEIPEDANYSVYRAVAGANIATQMANNDPAEQPVMIGSLTADGLKSFRLDEAPARAEGGQGRWFDWIVLYDEDAQNNLAVADLDADNDIPNGIPQTHFSPYELEDRTQSPVRVGFGEARLVQDDRDTYFLYFDDAFEIEEGASYDVYLAVAGAQLSMQMANNDPTEQPQLVGTVSRSGRQTIRLDMAPARAAGGQGRWFDWIVLHDRDENTNVAVADLDADGDLAPLFDAVVFNVVLDAAQEIPAPTIPEGLNPTGMATVEVRLSREEIRVSLSVSDLTGPVAMAHIHQGGPGMTGPVLFGLAGGDFDELDVLLRDGDFAAPGELSFEDVLELLAGGDAAYINVHTAANMPGEIRGNF